MQRILLMKLTLPLLLIILLSACSTDKADPMRVGTNLWPGYEPLYLAEELNYMTKDKVRLVEYPSASDVIRAFRNQSLEAAALTLDEALSLHQDNIPAEVVLVLDISEGADVIVARQGIENFKDLKGKKVAVESGALGAYVISRALALNNMTLSDINVVHLDVSNHAAAFKEGKVDAAVTFEPVRTKLLGYGGKEVFSSREIPGEVVDVLVIHRDYLQKNPKQAEHLASAWFKSIQYMTTSNADAVQRIAKRLKITPDEVIASYDGLQLAGHLENNKMLDGKKGHLHATLKKLSDTMVDNGLLKQGLELNGIINDRLIK